MRAFFLQAGGEINLHIQLSLRGLRANSSNISYEHYNQVAETPGGESSRRPRSL